MINLIRTYLRSSSVILLSIFFMTGCSGFLLGDENLSESVDLPSNPKAVNLQKKWQNSIGNGTDEKVLQLIPLVVKDRVFAVSSNGKLSAFSKESGQRLWRKEVGHSIAAGVSGNANTIVVGSSDGLLMAFTADEGKPLWIYQLSTEIMAAPAVVRGLVVARSIDGQVTALSEKDGNVIWKQSLGVAELSIRGNSRALFLDGVLLYTTGKGRMTLLNAANGKPVLDSPVSRGRGATAIERVADLLATPTIRGDVLFLSAYRHESLAINMKDGSLLWRSDLATALDLFADNRFVYVVDKNSIIYALDMRNGQAVWTSKVAEGRRLSPISGNGSHIASVDEEGNLLIIDSNNGQLLSYLKVGGGRTYVAPQWLGGKWLTYTSNGKLTLTESSQ